jgi:hypothetical protein
MWVRAGGRSFSPAEVHEVEPWPGVGPGALILPSWGLFSFAVLDSEVWIGLLAVFPQIHMLKQEPQVLVLGGGPCEFLGL